MKGINLIINPGEKIACVGRTGAGKSTLINVLFRMVEIYKDKSLVNDKSFIKIDGKDISKIGLKTLRSNLSIIP